MLYFIRYFSTFIEMDNSFYYLALVIWNYFCILKLHFAVAMILLTCCFVRYVQMLFGLLWLYVKVRFLREEFIFLFLRVFSLSFLSKFYLLLNWPFPRTSSQIYEFYHIFYVLVSPYYNYLLLFL